MDVERSTERQEEKVESQLSDSPDTLLATLEELSSKYKSVEDALNDKSFDIHKRLDDLSVKIQELEKSELDRKSRKIIDQARVTLAGMRKDLENLTGNFGIESKNTNKERVVATKEVAENKPSLNQTETELLEHAEMMRTYKYDHEKFASEEAYFRFLADDLTTPEKINMFLLHMYTYDVTYEKGKNQEYVNSFMTSDDVWAQPGDFVRNVNQSGRFSGDCDDIANLFEHVLSLQGKNPFMFSIPNHALVGWLEDSNGVLRANVIDTTAEGTAQAACRTMTAQPGESEKELFSRLVNSFSIKSDAKMAFDPDHINIGLLFPDGRAFDIPANFSLAQRSHELRAALEQKNTNAAAKIIDDEASKDPRNCNLLFARLQFSILLQKSSSDIYQQIDKLLPLLDGNLDSSMIKQTNQVAYFLKENGYPEFALQLLEQPLLRKNAKGRFDININDTLSDMYIANGKFEAAFNHDEIIIARIVERCQEKKISKDIDDMFEFLSLPNFQTMLQQRLSSHPDYESFIAQKAPGISSLYRKYVMEREVLPIQPSG